MACKIAIVRPPSTSALRPRILKTHRASGHDVKAVGIFRASLWVVFSWREAERVGSNSTGKGEQRFKVLYQLSCCTSTRQTANVTAVSILRASEVKEV